MNAPEISFQPKPVDRASRFFGVVLLFILIGPPIGSLVYVVAGFAALVQGAGNGEVLGLLAFIGLSYVPGFLPALVSGITVGIVQSAIGRVPWWVIPIASILAASVYGWRAAFRSLQIPIVSLSFFMTCLIATIGCVLVVQRIEKKWWRPTDYRDRSVSDEDKGSVP